ncbi:activator of 90 kDa heat shock protein ATPase homolog 1-like [Anneissia japonica]|uniref:activator of 90 kDa heat shock protein ATPase homolog 1-like n=1 Tax=Anneissia japonica TaxID=1529436 RepID=UPI00142550EA|nr:activator of 90 kDa heat shock protein ATPase homolog 1-like [Anneissia japonica]
MAKWGEGDPRWIVEERADATNVNNWHWTEKNATAWSKEKLLNLLMYLKVEDEKGTCEICELTSIEGEATANNRKAKLIFFYEWVLKLQWKGTLKDCETELKGEVEIPNLSDENDASEVDVKQLGNKCDIQRLKEQTPPKNLSNHNGVKDQIAGVKNLKVGVRIHTTKLTCTEKFNCAVEDIYQVLTDPKKVEAFTRSSAEMEVEKGGKFSLFGGNVTGFFDVLEMDKKIVQKWRFRNWPDAHYSVVTMEFSQEPDGASMKLVQTGVPDNEVERTKEGWKENFWARIRQTFGFGIHLF